MERGTYYEANREVRLAYQKEYDKKNKEKISERKRQWYLKKKAERAALYENNNSINPSNNEQV